MLSSGHEAPEDMKVVPNRLLDHFINWSGLQPYVEPDLKGSNFKMSKLVPDDAEPGAVSVKPSNEPIPDVEVIPIKSKKARGGRSTCVQWYWGRFCASVSFLRISVRFWMGGDGLKHKNF